MYPNSTTTATRASVFALLLGVLLCGLAPAATAQTITVMNTEDSGAGSLRKAVADIASGGTINFSPSLPAGATITLSSTITISKNLTIDGRNVPGLVIDGGWDGTTSSTAPGNRIFILPNTSTPTVSVNDLTLANGNACNTGGGSATGQPKCNGGAIYLEKGTLNLDRVTIRNSHANDGAAIKVQEGTLNATRSALFDNEARDDGGAIDTGGGAANPTANLTNVTIANNKAGTTNSGGTGGAVRVDGIINLTYVTIYGNNADNDGALDVNGTANVRASIVIGNTKYTNTTENTGSVQSGCSGTVTDNGYNWQASGDGCGFGTTTGGTTTVAALKLATVPAFNSGRTETLSLEVGSSVEGDIPTSEADCGAGAGATDQRTINRGVSALGPNPGCEPGAYELQSLPAGSDSDGDGILDTDEDANSDGDPTDDDEDRDGRPNFIDLDADGDGLADDTEIGPTPSSPRNSDSDGIADYLDIDADGDGIPDNVEAQATSAYTAPSAKDVDNDGLDDAYDNDTGDKSLAASVGLTPVNTDGSNTDGTDDTTPDYLDLDSDGDTIPDATEGHDTNFNGAPNTTPAGADADGDGLDNAFDAFDYSSVASSPATTGDNAANGTSDPATDYPNLNAGEPNWRDNDDDGDFILTKDETGDTNPTNGTPDYLEAGTLPVELGALEATTDGEAVVLNWQTSAERGNAGFHVEMREAQAGGFETLGFVAGAGTTTGATSYRFRADGLGAGRYTFRLKQVDRDGTARYSAKVEAVVEMAEAFVLESAYPNPFNPQATVRFAVREQQPVRAVLYDVMGREVQVLFDGTAAAGQMQTVRIDGSRLASGMYLVRVAGRSFSRTQTITLMK